MSKSQPTTSPVPTTVPAKDQRPVINNSRVKVSGRTGNFLTMSSTIKLEKFKGDGSQDVNAWLVNFSQWANFHDLPDNKILDAFPFYLEANAKIWYDALPNEIKSHPDTIKVLFQERFKELDNFLDLSVLQMKQNTAEPVSDYLSQIINQKCPGKSIIICGNEKFAFGYKNICGHTKSKNNGAIASNCNLG